MKYGSAVLTALEAQYASIEEIGKLIQHKRLKTFIEGSNSEEWLDCFWRTMAVLQAQRLRRRLYGFL